jgi:hypothetical protein
MASGWFYWTEKGKVRRITLNGQAGDVALSPKPTAIDDDNNNVYWWDETEGKLYAVAVESPSPSPKVIGQLAPGAALIASGDTFVAVLHLGQKNLYAFDKN